MNETWMQTGYSSLVRVGAQRGMACCVREVEHSLPSQLEPPEGCRETGPVFCMQINTALLFIERGGRARARGRVGECHCKPNM